MTRKCHVRFLGGRAMVTSPPYPTHQESQGPYLPVYSPPLRTHSMESFNTLSSGSMVTLSGVSQRW